MGNNNQMLYNENLTNSSHNSWTRYVGQVNGMIGEKPNFPIVLPAEGEVSCFIDPELMYKAKHEAWDGHSYKFEFWFFTQILKCEAVLYDKVISNLLDYNSRDYLWSHYKDDDRIYCRVYPESWNS